MGNTLTLELLSYELGFLKDLGLILLGLGSLGWL